MASQMASQVDRDGRDGQYGAGAAPATAPMPTMTTAPTAPTAPRQPEPAERAAPRELTAGERQGLMMGWVSLALGLFLLFAGLALWAAVALNAGFWGWLIAVGALGLVVLALIVAVNVTVLRTVRPER